MSKADVIAFHAPGTRVDFTDHKSVLSPARVLAVTIREDRVDAYEVSWWVSGQRYTAWVQPHEITGAETDIRTIGFDPG